MNLVNALPPCYHEFLAVEKGQGLPGIYYGKNSKNRINKYQFCGVRSAVYLYPLILDVEVIYENNKVITDSKFAFLFQVVDYGLVESVSTEVMITEINIFDPQQLFVAGSALVVLTFQILVDKLSDIKVQVSPGEETYIIYSVAIVDEQFRVKNFRGSVRLPSFQCIIVVHTKTGLMGRKFTYTPVRHNLPIYKIKLEKDKEISASFPNKMCNHTHGIYCALEVS